MVLHAVDNIRDNNLRFDQVIVDAQLFGAFFVFWLTESGQHDDPNVGSFWRVTEDVQNIKATDFWHHGVEKYEIRAEFDSRRQGIFTVINFLYFKAFEFETRSVDAGERPVVFNEQDFFLIHSLIIPLSLCKTQVLLFDGRYGCFQLRITAGIGVGHRHDDRLIWSNSLFGDVFTLWRVPFGNRDFKLAPIR